MSVQARKLEKSDPEEMLRICSGLLDYTPAEVADMESAIRIGDVFALMVVYYQTNQMYDKAYQLIEKVCHLTWQAANALLTSD